MPDLTCFYQFNVQARSLGTQFLTNARKYVPNENSTEKGEGKGVNTKETKQTQANKKGFLNLQKY